MKRNILTKGILSLIALGALCFTTACSDIDNVKEDGNTSKGLRFTVTDIQVSKEASLPQRSEKSVYETQRIAFQNANGLDVCIKETTVEGVNAVQQQDNGTRAELKTATLVCSLRKTVAVLLTSCSTLKQEKMDRFIKPLSGLLERQESSNSMQFIHF